MRHPWNCLGREYCFGLGGPSPEHNKSIKHVFTNKFTQRLPLMQTETALKLVNSPLFNLLIQNCTITHVELTFHDSEAINICSASVTMCVP